MIVPLIIACIVFLAAFFTVRHIRRIGLEGDLSFYRGLYYLSPQPRYLEKIRLLEKKLGVPHEEG